MASAEQQEDENIVWENPDTPASADDFVFVDGKRMVRPYFFEFLCHVKKRWEGKTVVDLFSGEFRQRPREYYIEAVLRGRIRVNGVKVTPTYVTRDAQKISHFVHRHEPPVLAEHVTVLEEGPDVITVNKPASVPVHPCGQYRKNTVVGILQAEHKTGQLFPIHRLDRLVSGLLILARNSQTADRFRREIEGGRVTKNYVAKVKGVFPAHEVVLNAAVTYDPKEGVSTCSVEPSPDKDNKGKDACTKFQRLSTDGIYSIVRCEPVTGRTHQIRVHLQHLGHPIANDNLYLQACPPKRTREGTTADTAAKIARSFTKDRTTEVDSLVACRQNPEADQRNTVHERSRATSVDDTRDTSEEKFVEADEAGKRTVFSASRQTNGGSLERMETIDTGKISSDGKEQDVKNQSHIQQSSKSSSQQFKLDVLCTHCPELGPSGYKQDDEGLWLHCVRYTCASWTKNLLNEENCVGKNFKSLEIETLKRLMPD
ncbi:hypothetical protein R1flu_011580 [Riccia fluitans]|uniref:Pseudouridine synthase n=1 Tax=Riccia fluitans TaxID=41844 RepID=A0ABD1Z868_9MARC